MKEKSLSYKILIWAVVVAAYGVLIYQLLVFDDYASFFRSFRLAGLTHYIWLAVVFLLLPANLMIEAVKWQLVLKNYYPLSFKESFLQILWGQTGAFLTPNRIGEFPTRVLAMPYGYRLKSIALGMIGAMAQGLVMALGGIVTMPFFFSKLLDERYRQSIEAYMPVVWVLALIMLVVYYCLPFFGSYLLKSRYEKLHDFARSIQELSFRQSSAILWVCFLKYLCFCLQFYGLIYFFGVTLSPIDALVAIPVFYLFMTFTPSINVAELGIRTSYAALVIGVYATETIGLIFASATLWVINFCLPMILGSLFAKKIAY